MPCLHAFAEFVYRHAPAPGILTLVLAVVAAVVSTPMVVDRIKGSWWGHAVLFVILGSIAAMEIMVINHADVENQEHFGTLLWQFNEQSRHFDEQRQTMAANLQAIKDLDSYLRQRSSIRTKIEPFTKPSLKQRAFELSAAILQHLASREFFARTPALNSSKSFEQDASMWVAYDRQTVEEYKEKFEFAVRKIRDEFAAQGLTDTYVQQFTNTDPINSTSVRVLAEGIGRLAKQLKD